jgi:AraC-like DNA-binding protein
MRQLFRLCAWSTHFPRGELIDTLVLVSFKTISLPAVRSPWSDTVITVANTLEARFSLDVNRRRAGAWNGARSGCRPLLLQSAPSEPEALFCASRPSGGHVIAFDTLELLDEVRSALACALVLRPGLSVAQVAEQLGFSDASTFYRRFKRWTGLTPAQFQKRGR